MTPPKSKSKSKSTSPATRARTAASRSKPRAGAKARPRRTARPKPASPPPATVEAYLAAQPPDRRAVLSEVRSVVRRHLPDGYEEGIGWGAITWHIPLSRLPDTYNKQPLAYAALAPHKSYYTLYLMGPYGSPKLLRELEDGFRAAGKTLDMGKSCVHFRSIDDLPLDVIGRSIAAIPAEQWIEIYRASRRR
jgi:hypothetical protein